MIGVAIGGSTFGHQRRSSSATAEIRARRDFHNVIPCVQSARGFDEGREGRMKSSGDKNARREP